ncbi:hypothetical protein ACWCL1_08665 [Ligilactobacillus sp. LYQ135]
MNNQKKKTVAWIVGLVVLIVVIIGGIFGIKHYMTENTYEKPINAVLAVEHRTGDKQVTKNNSKISIYDYSDEGNDYLINITFYPKNSNSTITDQCIVDKTTMRIEDSSEVLPVSNLKKLYESDNLKK